MLNCWHYYQLQLLPAIPITTYCTYILHLKLGSSSFVNKFQDQTWCSVFFHFIFCFLFVHGEVVLNKLNRLYLYCRQCRDFAYIFVINKTELILIWKFKHNKSVDNLTKNTKKNTFIILELTSFVTKQSYVVYFNP